MVLSRRTQRAIKEFHNVQFLESKLGKAEEKLSACFPIPEEEVAEYQRITGETVVQFEERQAARDARKEEVKQ